MEAAAGAISDLDDDFPSTAICCWREGRWTRTEAAAGAFSDPDDDFPSTASCCWREGCRTRTEAAAGAISDLDDDFPSTASCWWREGCWTRTEAAAGAISDLDDDFSNTAACRWRELRPNHSPPPHSPTYTPPPPSHTHTSSPLPPRPPTTHTTLLSPHSPPIARRHTPRGRSCTPGFPGDRFSSLGGTGGLHPRYTPSYIHAAHHSHYPYTPPTRPLLTGSPQAETGTYVYCHRRRRRHRNRHDGAVAHPAQLPAATPRCRILPISSLADRAGQEPARCRSRVGRGLSAGHSPLTLGLLVSPLPSQTTPLHYTPDPHTHTHDTYTYTHAHAPLCAAQLCSIPDPPQHLGL